MKIVAIDFDGTMQRSSTIDRREVAMWTNVVAAFQACGWRVVIATMRTREMSDEIEQYLQAMGRDLHVVYCGQSASKRAGCAAVGIKPDIWIDDMPETIGDPWLSRAGADLGDEV